jgi:hypothetical protein
MGVKSHPIKKVMPPSSGLKRTIVAIMNTVTIKCRELLDQLMNCQLLKDVFRGFNVVYALGTKAGEGRELGTRKEVKQCRQG